MARLTVAPAMSSSNQQGAYVIRLHSQGALGKLPIGCWSSPPAETDWIYSAAWKQILNIEHGRLSGSSISDGFHHFIVQKTNKKSILNRLALTAYSAPHYCQRFPWPCSFLGIDFPVLAWPYLSEADESESESDSDLDLDALFESSSPSSPPIVGAHSLPAARERPTQQSSAWPGRSVISLYPQCPLY